MVLVPGLDVEGQEAGEEGRDGLPALAHVGRAGEEEDLEAGVEGVDAVIEELAEGAGLVGAAPAERRTEPRSALLSSQVVLERKAKTYACDPSTASKVWYKNKPTAQL